MSKKEKQELSKKEQYRAEREARIEALRNEDGSKKPIKVKDKKKRKRGIWIAVAVLLALVLVFYITWLLGVPRRYLNAAEVGDADIKVTEYNYSYFSTYNTYNQYFGGGGLLNLREDSSEITGQEMSWGDFFRESTEKSLQEVNIVYQKALEAGYTLDEEEQASIDNFFAQRKAQIGTPLDFEVYLEAAYGKGMKEDVLRKILEKQTLAAKYSREAPDKYEITAEDISREYEENKDDYDLYSYLNYVLRTPTKDEDGNDLSAEEINEKKKDYEKIADKIKEEADSPEALAALLVEEGVEEEGFDLASYTYKNRPGSIINEGEGKDWLTDEARKEGDITSLASGNNFKILYFLSRDEDSRKTADAYVAVFPKRDDAGKDLTEDQISAIQQEAEKLGEELKSSEDYADYAAKAPEENVPKASMVQRYEGVVSNQLNTFEEEVLSYILSPDVRTQKSKVIETDYAVYLVFVEKTYDQSSKDRIIEDKMQADSYSKDLDSWLASDDYAFEEKRPGFWMTGK